MQVQPDNKLQSTVVRNPPCSLNTARRPAYVTYWEKLEVSGRDSVGGAFVIFFRETEKNHKFPRYLLYFVSMCRIDPLTQNTRFLVCTRVASVEECIRNHVQEETFQVLVQHSHAKKCATDPECYISGLLILMFNAVCT